MIELKDINYTVYRADEAGQPEFFEAGKYYFEPNSYDSTSVYSVAYATQTEAIKAAQEDAIRVANEALE